MHFDLKPAYIGSLNLRNLPNGSVIAVLSFHLSSYLLINFTALEIRQLARNVKKHFVCITALSLILGCIQKPGFFLFFSVLYPFFSDIHLENFICTNKIRHNTVLIHKEVNKI